MHRLHGLGAPLRRPSRRALGLPPRRGGALRALDQPEHPSQVPNLRIFPLLVRDEAPVELREPGHARDDLVPRHRALRHRVPRQPHLRNGREIVQGVHAVPVVDCVIGEQERPEPLEGHRSPGFRDVRGVPHASQPVAPQVQPLQRRERREFLHLGPLLDGVALQVERLEARERREVTENPQVALAQARDAAVREAQFPQGRAGTQDRGRLAPRRPGPVHDEDGEVRKRRRARGRDRRPRRPHPGDVQDAQRGKLGSERRDRVPVPHQVAGQVEDSHLRGGQAARRRIAGLARRVDGGVGEVDPVEGAEHRVGVLLLETQLDLDLLPVRRLDEHALVVLLVVAAVPAGRAGRDGKLAVEVLRRDGLAERDAGSDLVRADEGSRGGAVLG
mmetsp:Transcript_9652/g.42140  ORF Transcript_9652/g.42140 Transcript_9652/m.42140 type:complete len:389 (+) Transcript_9652:1048-2214(+)